MVTCLLDFLSSNRHLAGAHVTVISVNAVTFH